MRVSEMHPGDDGRMVSKPGTRELDRDELCIVPTDASKYDSSSAVSVYKAIRDLAQRGIDDALERERIEAKTDRALEEAQKNTSDIARIESKVDEGFDRIDNGYIYPEERRTLESIRYSRVFRLLGLDVMNPETDEYGMIEAQYKRRFIARMTNELKKRFGVVGNWFYLRHRDYAAACEFFRNWRPAEGVEAYKRQIDRRAKANKRANDEGYTKRK